MILAGVQPEAEWGVALGLVGYVDAVAECGHGIGGGAFVLVQIGETSHWAEN